jgi:hypothetical protein
MSGWWLFVGCVTFGERPILASALDKVSKFCYLWRNSQTRMNLDQIPPPTAASSAPPRAQVADELTRVKIFLFIQFFFLVVSVFTGGFNFKLWSMLDTALMIQSIGVTALVVVLEEPHQRKLAFKAAIILYLLAVLDMGINVLISGVVGWKT